jgi:hypothetical protein
VESILGARYEAAFRTDTEVSEQEYLPSEAADIPRGALTEIAGCPSSGMTSLLYSLLAVSTSGQEFCVLLDTSNAFDPESAAAAGVELSQLLWVRCSGNAEHALKAADMLANAGGFGVIAIDLTEASAKTLQRIPLSAWFRLRKAVENTKTALVVASPRIQARSCSALKIELSRSKTLWSGQLLEGFEVRSQSTRNYHLQENYVRVSACPR